ncbi:MAG: hypothetical protein QT02_C0002G0071 [archaeon GW2011_AR9]|nr:MAG: hypothetical protein QT02_C0002G0071 [archaeon GW2011_AR9]MBS3120615.1 hypothetical protein [Candidatus Woesearchaeota archaeon]HIG92872.1 hypothetical protein [Candidatus Woesearchaeota archaeon]HIH12475.1 hypothetical protein [Candidatus Woesearchaeota archaeon]
MTSNYYKPKLFLAIVLVIIMLVVIVISWAAYLQSSCSAMQSIPASIQVKDAGKRPLLGFNTNTDHLNFGAVSPNIMSSRKVEVQHDQDAHVTVSMDGDFETWVRINPAEFDLKAQETKEVYLEANVPRSAPDGNYSGQVIFCFKE